MLYINLDCGLKLLPRRIVMEKLRSMVEGVRVVRKELKKKRAMKR